MGLRRVAGRQEEKKEKWEEGMGEGESRELREMELAEGEGKQRETGEKETRERKRRKVDLPKEQEEQAKGSRNYAGELEQQEELLRYYEQRDEAKRRGTSWLLNPVPNSGPSASSAPASFGALFTGSICAASSASSVHSRWSSSTQRSSASSASSSVSDFTCAPSGACPTPTMSSDLGDNRSPTIDTYKASTGAWTTANSSGVEVGNSPVSGGPGSCAHNYPRSEAEWHRLQEEQACKQQEQFKRDSMRAAWAAADTSLTASGREQMRRAWSSYEYAWATLKDRPVLYFRTMPWPVLKSPMSVKELTANAIGAFVLSPAHSSDKSARNRLKEQLRRWHPDRFESKWLSKASVEEEAVRQGASKVVCILNELMAMESNPFG
ncbi:hypothetical protein M0805_004833 [Coniferiporia weirii]|nr:hypothetical protein M0805_004833 [Coniferiporia weirii]